MAFYMPVRFASSGKMKALVVVAAALFLVAAICACRRSSSKDPKANNNSTSSTNEPGSEQAKLEAASLVAKGKELFQNDQDQQAADAFQQAIRLHPDFAEAHLRLGMAYAALEKKAEAEGSYKKAIELFKKIVQANPKDETAFFYLGEAHSLLHQDEEAARAFRQATA